MPGKAFERALERFRNKLTEEQYKQFKASSLDDVNAEIQAIQSRLGSLKKMRSLNRLSKFLEAMSQIEQLVQVFLNVSEVVAFVWGPIKLALLVAGSRVEVLECLLDTYVEVGEVIPGLRQYDELFGAAPLVLEVLEKYLCDILEFHHNALDVFARPSWIKFFDSTWKTFKTRFKPIIESLKRHRTLLLDERLNAAVLEIQKGREQTIEQLNNSSRHFTDRFDGLDGHIEEVYTKLSSQIYDMQQSSKAEKASQHATIHLLEMNSIISKLDPPHVDGDQDTTLNSCHSKSGEWLFQNPAYLRWAGSEALPYSVLFIHGMPGAGKTLLASRIISHLRPLAGAACLFFYFKQSENTKRSMGNMLRALLVQLIRQDNSIVPDLYRKCSLVSNTEARQLPTLQNWLMEVLESQTTCSIVLDGLDECNHHGSGDEAGKILDRFITTVIPHCSRAGAKLRLLALGQRDGVVDSALSGYSSISLDYSAAHLDDIQSFARSRALELSKRFALDQKEESNIVQKVATTAKGMFLYAKVVMDNLIAQGSLDDLDQELGMKFPSGLDQAYERVVFRVLDSPARHQSQREAAAKIIGWLTCAVRPLRWNEIQALFCIDPYKEGCNPRCRRLDSCKALCGSFVEVDEHDPSSDDSQEISPEVNLVHDTARRYLFQAHRVDEFEGNADMAILSSAYLASSPFCKGEDILTAALTGYYGLQDYMVSSWQNHLTLSFEQKSRLSPETTEKLRVAIHTLLQNLNLNIIAPEVSAKDLEALISILEDDGFENCTRHLEQRSSTVRGVSEKIVPSVLDARTREVFLSLNGRPQYKCPKLSCLMFSRGFKAEKDRDTHIAQHYSQFVCSAEGCPRQAIGFTSCQDLEKHTEKAHPSSPKPFNLFPSLKPPANMSSACKSGNLNAVESFVEAGHDLQANDKLSPIVIAARYGHFDLCHYLVQKGCSIFKVSKNMYAANTALGEAIKSRNTKLFKALLDLATESETQKFIDGELFSFHFGAAINSGGREILEVLLQFGPKREKPLSYADIFNAAVAFRPRSLNRIDASNLYQYFYTLLSTTERSLILKRIGLSDTNNLHIACKENNRNAVSFLLGPMETKDIFVRNKQGETPFFVAVQSGSIECVQTFLEYDATKSVDALDDEKNRPLHCACRWRSRGIFKLLLPYSVNQLNDQNKYGQTPLHVAVDIGRYKESNVKVQAILETGAVDLSIRDNEGRTVFDFDSTPETQSLLNAARQWEKVAESPNDGDILVESSVRDNEHRTEMGPEVQSLSRAGSSQESVAETPENRAISPTSEEVNWFFAEVSEPAHWSEFGNRL